MEVVEEMKKLRELLDKRGITWEDASEEGAEGYKDLWICRTWFNYNGLRVSCINGLGTYGGFGGANPSDGNYGLLEMMIEGFEPIGWQKAKECIAILDLMTVVSKEK